MILDIEEIYIVGENTFIDSVSVDNLYAVTFEDNEETGYYYALENREQEFEIVDALHIYDVENVIGKEKNQAKYKFFGMTIIILLHC